jgi:4-amino-4-deoxy-L-arabinose transferase-like glycosyltransferase
MAFRAGNLPYASFYFPYPPLFLYALTAFSYLGTSWGPAVPLVLADALTVVPVYLIARRFLSERAAFIASLVFVVAPLNLLYADYVWLNPPLTTLFLMVSLYFLLEGRYDLSAVALAVSIGFKQTALIAAPLMLVFLWRKSSRKVAARFFLLVAAVCVVFSIPYILVSPALYLASMFRVPMQYFGGLPASYFQLGVIAPSTSISTINTATLPSYDQVLAHVLGVGYPATLTGPIFAFLLPALAQGYYSISQDVLVIVLLAAYVFTTIRLYRSKLTDDGALVRYLVCGFLLFFALYPVYKYYVVGVTPFLVLLGARKRDWGAFLGFNLALIVVPSVFASYLPLAALAWLLRPRSASQAFANPKTTV